VNKALGSGLRCSLPKLIKKEVKVKQYTKEELIALGEKVAKAREREVERNRIRQAAVKKLISAHLEEFQNYLKEISDLFRSNSI